MNLLAIGCNYATPVAVRERLAFNDEQSARALAELSDRLGYEAVLLSTCNRVELYAVPPADAPDLPDYLANFHGLHSAEIRPHLYVHRDAHAVRHLFRVTASLDSLVVGEGQIAGQVRKAYDRALQRGATGGMLNALFPHARRVSKRVRSETKIGQGSVSVSSAAVEYVREVFDHFGDKSILVIGAGKMGELTLRHLRQLQPKRIWVTNRSPEKAAQVAAGCGGEAVPWERLDEALARADIVLSTTGAPEPIMTLDRYVRATRRREGTTVILDIAVPRDFDPRIDDGDRTFLFNIDDLKKIRERTLQARRAHVSAAEAIVEQEAQKFANDWARRKNGPMIECLTRDLERKRQEIEKALFARLNGKLDEADRRAITKAMQMLQNQFLHGPIAALKEEPQPGGHTMAEALRKMFRLE